MELLTERDVINYVMNKQRVEMDLIQKDKNLELAKGHAKVSCSMMKRKKIDPLRKFKNTLITLYDNNKRVIDGFENEKIGTLFASCEDEDEVDRLYDIGYSNFRRKWITSDQYQALDNLFHDGGYPKTFLKVKLRMRLESE